ncbi:MAG: transporter [Ilumatobacteraceae bacterium]|nr:transporter [Ilumatobacteraceae bacterium]
MTDALHDDASPHVPAARPTVVLAVLCFSQLLLAIDVTIVAVANPSIGAALGFDDASLQWTITAYALTFGGFLLLGGRVADLFDRRMLFVVGIGGFTAASVIAAVAQSPVQLVAARAVQGLCAAAISPCTLSILASTFAEGPSRRRAYGLWAATGSLGGAVGFLLGGLLTSGFGWRSIFLINVPVGVAAVLCALRFLPRHSATVERQPVDLPGAVTVTLGSGLMIFGVSQAESHGWSSPACWGPIVGGVLLTVVFLGIERRAAHPLLPMRIVRRKGSVALLPLVMIAVLSNAVVYLTSLFLQNVLGFSAGESGAAVLGLPVGFGIGVNISAWLVERLGVRRQAVLGFGLIGVSAAWLARSSNHASLATSIIPGTFGAGLGLGITLVVLITTVTSGVDQGDQGIVAGVYGMSQQLGGAVGLAVLASIAASGGIAGVARTVDQHGHAIRLAFVVSAGIAAVTVIVVRLTLPRTVDDPADPALIHDAAISSALPGEITILES